MQKPEALIEYFVKTYTNVGDTVLDPCRGSNTAGVVCDRLGRNYIGIEKDKTFFDNGLQRRKKRITMSLPKPTKKAETLQGYNHRLKIEARELSKKHVDVKLIKYDLKR